MKKNIFFLTLLFTTGFLQAQKQNADFIRRAISVAVNGKDSAELYLQLSKCFGWNDADSMNAYAVVAKEIAQQNGNDTLLVKAYIRIAYAHYVTGKSSEGIEMGMLAYQLAGKLNREDLVAAASNILGLLYQNVKKYEESVSFLDIAVANARENNDKPLLATTLNNLANSYLKLNRISESLKLRKEALAIREQIGNPAALSDTYNDIAETYIKIHLKDSALYYLSFAYKMKQDLNDREMMAVIAMNYGELYASEKNYNESIRWYLTAEENARKIGANSYLSDLYEQLAVISFGQGKIEDAYNYRLLHEQYKDSVLNLESQQQLNELNSKFQSEKKSLEIESLKKEKEKNKSIADEKEFRNRLIFFFSILFIVSIGFYSILLYRKFKLARKQKALIEIQKILVENKQKEILDSIHYAQRIQQSLLPTEKYLDTNLHRLKQK
ncbi:hypothetical protein BH09BAC5_BH09BAC5_15320 [soil metagenome]